MLSKLSESSARPLSKLADACAVGVTIAVRRAGRSLLDRRQPLIPSEARQKRQWADVCDVPASEARHLEDLPGLQVGGPDGVFRAEGIGHAGRMAACYDVTPQAVFRRITLIARDNCIVRKRSAIRRSMRSKSDSHPRLSV